MKINKGTKVYHYSKGKGYILHIQQRKRTALLTCWFPTGCEFITKQALQAGTGEITLTMRRKTPEDEGSLDSLLSSLMGKL